MNTHFLTGPDIVSISEAYTQYQVTEWQGSVKSLIGDIVMISVFHSLLKITHNKQHLLCNVEEYSMYTYLIV